MDEVTQMLVEALERLTTQTTDGLASLSRRLETLERLPQRSSSSPSSSAPSTNSELLWQEWEAVYRAFMARKAEEHSKKHGRDLNAPRPSDLDSVDQDVRPACRTCGLAGVLRLQGDIRVFCKAMNATMQPLECPSACSMKAQG